MKMMKALPLGFLVLAFAAATALGCSRGSPCGGNECCSEYGYCGTGGSYCGTGCQSGPCYGKGAILNENGVPANACSGGSPCPGNECCSRWGYCGTGGEYCGSGCQSGPCYVAKLRGRVAGAVTDALIDQVVPTGRGCPTPPCPPQIK